MKVLKFCKTNQYYMSFTSESYLPINYPQTICQPNPGASKTKFISTLCIFVVVTYVTN